MKQYSIHISRGTSRMTNRRRSFEPFQKKQQLTGSALQFGALNVLYITTAETNGWFPVRFID
jgi:hypothetical protein